MSEAKQNKTKQKTKKKTPTVLQSKMKATEQLFPVVLFTIPYKGVLILSRWMKSLCVTIQEKGL